MFESNTGDTHNLDCNVLQELLILQQNFNFQLISTLMYLSDLPNFLKISLIV